MKKKLRSRSGLTLFEVVAATLVLSILSLAIAGGVSVAANVYRSSVFVSESEILNDTINISLSDVLRYSRYTGTDGNGAVLFTNNAYGIASGHFLTVGGRIYMNPGSGDDADLSTLMVLVNNGTYTSMDVTEFTIQYDPVTAIFHGSYVITQPGSTPLVKYCNFTFRSVAYQQAD